MCEGGKVHDALTMHDAGKESRVIRRGERLTKDIAPADCRLRDEACPVDRVIGQVVQQTRKQEGLASGSAGYLSIDFPIFPPLPPLDQPHVRTAMAPRARIAIMAEGGGGSSARDTELVSEAVAKRGARGMREPKLGGVRGQLPNSDSRPPSVFSWQLTGRLEI
jgi:hypothetical protein